MTDFARGEKLRYLREERRLTQVEAAYESGFSDRSIRAWEHGAPIKWKHAQKYARFYGVDPESVVTRDLKPPVEPEDIEEIKAQLAELTARSATARPADEGDPEELEQAARELEEESEPPEEEDDATGTEGAGG